MMKKWIPITMDESTDQGELEFFFWLEDDTSLPTSLTEEDFNERIKATQAAERKWRTVELD